MKTLMDYLPELYLSSREVTVFQEAWQPEVDLVWKARDDLLAQLNPNTATWGLALWEEALGLPSDESIPASSRRIRMIARLRGMGTTTPARLQSVLETFCPGCDVSVVEHFRKYLVEIKLRLTDHRVEDMPGLKAMLKLIMPAHLAWGFSIQLESSGKIQYGAAAEFCGCMEVWPLAGRKIEATGGIRSGATAELEGTLTVWPMAGRKIEASGGIRSGAAAESEGTLTAWPMAGRKIEASGVISPGTAAEPNGSLTVWPMAGREIESSAAHTQSAAFTHRPRIEIYPMQGGN